MISGERVIAGNRKGTEWTRSGTAAAHTEVYKRVTCYVRPLSGQRTIKGSCRRRRTARHRDQRPSGDCPSGARDVGVPSNFPLNYTRSGSLCQAGSGFVPRCRVATECRRSPFRGCGDNIWDLLAAGRARASSAGLLSGGCEQEEIEKAGANRTLRGPS